MKKRKLWSNSVAELGAVRNIKLRGLWRFDLFSLFSELFVFVSLPRLPSSFFFPWRSEAEGEREREGL